ncbi:hypothetical protein HELRODRAFT_177287 [Helobdella robusta]|uniref:Endonuclease/exonuclease/phosphatase domain-containing protein n=1 Tax=Helobdella robusta TaxID=6412 RepID=T1FBG5_HELRO|nr:hypothetical protein HELRODRAFT_177287 [Helobdella robusta]ESN98056.1 hypothetical protein HELRODRAFT_177287 [Helobdella robusta]
MDSASKDKLNFERLLLFHKFHALINLPTRVTTSSASVLDNILTNQNGFHQAGVVIADLSDHYPVFCLTNNMEVQKVNSSSNRNNVPKLNVNKIKTILNNTNWDFILNDGDVNRCVQKFLDYFRRTVDDCCKFLPPVSSKFKKSWMNADLLKLCKEKNKQYLKLIKDPSPNNLFVYKCLRNSFTKAKRNAEKQFYDKLFKLNNNNIKAKWRLINEVMNVKKQTTRIDHLKLNDCTISDKKEICNTLNRNFIDTINSLQGGFNQNLQHEMFSDQNINTFYLDEINTAELFSIVNSFKPNKSTSDDVITVAFTRLFYLMWSPESAV